MKMDAEFEEDMKMKDVEHEPYTDKHKKYKLMTLEDVAHELEKDFVEEIADSKRYLCMAHIAERAGDNEDCHYLTEIAKDEYTHAYFIHNFMIEHDIHIPEEYKHEFEELKETMRSFF